MVDTSPINEVLAVALRTVSSPGRKAAMGVAIVRGEKDMFVLYCVQAETDRAVIILEEVEPVAFDRIPLVVDFFESLHNEDLSAFLLVDSGGSYRRKWVLVEPKNLSSRLFNGCIAEFGFNPVL